MTLPVEHSNVVSDQMKELPGFCLFYQSVLEHAGILILAQEQALCGYYHIHSYLCPVTRAETVKVGRDVGLLLSLCRRHKQPLITAAFCRSSGGRE